MINWFKTKRLSEVFGIQSDLPKYTYLARERYDNNLNYYLDTQKHIVIHGASKQGKTSLRKRTFHNRQSLVIQCLPDKSVNDLIMDIYRELNITLPQSVSKTKRFNLKSGGSVKSKSSAHEARGELAVDFSKETKEEANHAQGYNYDFRKIKSALTNKRLIFEDFHYLDEATRQELAFYLKGFYEEQIFVIVIGIWSEQNLLTYYNGDLSGRIEELDLTWTEEELYEVIEKGENALKIDIDGEIKTELVKSSFNNVGLTQRLAEKLCLNSGVTNSTPWYKRRRKIGTDEILAKTISDVIIDIRQRYVKILDVFQRGFEQTTLEVYFNIFKAISVIEQDELIHGISQSQLLNKVKEFQPKIRLSDLTAALNRIERLQSSRGITPFLLTYNENLREVHLVDREFLFYNTYGKPDWDWL